jgi:CRISPR-associated exonuclease Cas4
MMARLAHGVIVCGDGTRHRIENTDELRTFVLEVADHIPVARRQVDVPSPVKPVLGQCRNCGVRNHYGHARL